jgi:hypothetical protein
VEKGLRKHESGAAINVHAINPEMKMSTGSGSTWIGNEPRKERITLNRSNNKINRKK